MTYPHNLHKRSGIEWRKCVWHRTLNQTKWGGGGKSIFVLVFGGWTPLCMHVLITDAETLAGMPLCSGYHGSPVTPVIYFIIVYCIYNIHAQTHPWFRPQHKPCSAQPWISRCFYYRGPWHVGVGDGSATVGDRASVCSQGTLRLLQLHGFCDRSATLTSPWRTDVVFMPALQSFIVVLSLFSWASGKDWHRERPRNSTNRYDVLMYTRMMPSGWISSIVDLRA